MFTIANLHPRLLLKYDDGKKDKIVLAATGEGNPVEAIKPLLQPDQVHFAYAKIVCRYLDAVALLSKLITYIFPIYLRPTQWTRNPRVRRWACLHEVSWCT